MSLSVTLIAMVSWQHTVKISSGARPFYIFVNFLNVVDNIVIAFHFTFEWASIKMSNIGQSLVKPLWGTKLGGCDYVYEI